MSLEGATFLQAAHALVWLLLSAISKYSEDLTGVGCIFKYIYHYRHTHFCVPVKAFVMVPIAGTSGGS